MNAVVVGHVDHGKSTLIGRLLYDSEALPEERMGEIQKLLGEYRKRFEFAYFLDSFEEELQEERTIDTTRVQFKGARYHTIVDVPGHKEFIKNMLTGASHAQASVMVVSATDGRQEQTGRHAFLLNMLGIRSVIVAVNKMDLVGYTQDRFQAVKDDVAGLLSALGFSATTFIPISAVEGDNVYKASERMEWYSGPTVIQALDGLDTDEVVDKPLRFVVQDMYSLRRQSITVGRVESGLLKKGDEILFQPSGTRREAKAIYSYPEEVAQGRAGETIGVLMDGETTRGDVGGHIQSPPMPVSGFLGEVVMLEGDLRKGDEFEVRCGTKRVKCLVAEIRERINSETGAVIEKGVTHIRENEAATVVLHTGPLVVERFSDIPELGRFVLALSGRNVGAGVVLEPNR